MKPLLFSLNAATSLLESIEASQGLERGEIEHRRFPDGECYIRLLTPVDDRAVIILCSLDRPDERLMALILAADAARRQGAYQVGLIAPYLAYMRQDQQFRSGEAVSVHSFAAILSEHFDWLVTSEPHLHRIAKLSDVYSIPARTAEATGPIGDWIASNVKDPYLIGPDSESAAWIERIADYSGAQFAVFEKQRLGDRQVRMAGSLDMMQPHMTPVVIDDIVSSGGTMAAITNQIAQFSDQAAVCIAVHALAEKMPQFADASSAAPRFVSCNSVAHPSNSIDIAEPLLLEAQDLIKQTEARHRL